MACAKLSGRGDESRTVSSGKRFRMVAGKVRVIVAGLMVISARLAKSRAG